MVTEIARTRKEWANMGYETANEILSATSLFERLEILQDLPETMTPYEYWIRKSKAELMQCYMNAVVTTSCTGHQKAERNEQAAKYYHELMTKHNVPVPANEICYVLGEFNGDGSK